MRTQGWAGLVTADRRFDAIGTVRPGRGVELNRGMSCGLPFGPTSTRTRCTAERSTSTRTSRRPAASPSWKSRQGVHAAPQTLSGSSASATTTADTPTVASSPTADCRESSPCTARPQPTPDATPPPATTQARPPSPPHTAQVSHLRQVRNFPQVRDFRSPAQARQVRHFDAPRAPAPGPADVPVAPRCAPAAPYDTYRSGNPARTRFGRAAQTSSSA